MSEQPKRMAALLVAGTVVAGLAVPTFAAQAGAVVTRLHMTAELAAPVVELKVPTDTTILDGFGSSLAISARPWWWAPPTRGMTGPMLPALTSSSHSAVRVAGYTALAGRAYVFSQTSAGWHQTAELTGLTRSLTTTSALRWPFQAPRSLWVPTAKTVKPDGPMSLVIAPLVGTRWRS